MNKNDKLAINIKILDRQYPLKVERSDEEKIRKAAKLINDKILQYQQRYSNKDVQDFLSMTALQFVTKIIEIEERQDATELAEEIKDINAELTEYLEHENNVLKNIE